MYEGFSLCSAGGRVVVSKEPPEVGDVLTRFSLTVMVLGYIVKSTECGGLFRSSLYAMGKMRRFLEEICVAALKMGCVGDVYRHCGLQSLLCEHR